MKTKTKTKTLTLTLALALALTWIFWDVAGSSWEGTADGRFASTDLRSLERLCVS
jgi:hypothetical protein